jgi:hypothetical protein
MAADQDVLQHRHGAEETEILEGAADAERGDAVARRLEQRDALELDGPLVELIEPAEAVEQRRLARAVRADEAADLAALDVEGDAVEGDDAAEALGDAGYAEQRLPLAARQRRRGRPRSGRCTLIFRAGISVPSQIPSP